MTTPCTVLVSVADPASSDEIVRLGAVCAGGGRVILTHVLTVPPGMSLTTETERAQDRRQALHALAVAHGLDQARVVVRAGRDVAAELARVAAEEFADLLLLGWRAPEAGAPAFGPVIDALLAHPPCDMAVVSPNAGRETGPILAPVRGGPSAELALRLAGTLARARGETVTVLHVFRRNLPGPLDWDDDRPYWQAMSHLVGQTWMQKHVESGVRVEDAILAEASEYPLVILGASGETASRPGATLPALLHHTVGCGVIVVKTPQPLDAWLHRSRPAPSAPPWSSTIVDKWFAENTFHAREFNDLDELVALKRRRGVTISLGLPTLDEEATIGREIAVLRRALMEDAPLLDEIVVIDSGSADRTSEVAQRLGVPTYLHSEILAEEGTSRGKGEALWKSLHVLRGDLIAWVDTDIRNIHPKFVYGLLGPLLREPRIGYVKGYYQRPIQVGSRRYETGGGRVTELTARPLLNLFFPELSGVIQPLAGEYAGRREILEQLPFFTGYGVEIGLLIDILDRYGLDRIGQVNLEARVHRNRELTSLSLMAFAIVQVVMARLGDRARAPLVEQMNTAMKLISLEGGLALEVREIRERERPPIITLPAYRTRRALVSAAGNPMRT